MDQPQRRKIRLTARNVTWAAVVIDAALAAGKLLVGIVSGSQAILADSLHGASDLVTDVVVLAGLAISRRPADVDHHYGHRRVSTLIAMSVGAALLAAAGWIAYRAVVSLNAPTSQVRAALPFWIATASIPVKELLYQVTRHVGRRESDLSLMANAWHHRTDALTSVAAAVGLAGVLLSGPEWQKLDALTALVLAAFLVLVAARIIHRSAAELADQAPSPKTLESIRRAVSETEGVKTFHAFRARQTGGKVEMDIHVQVDPALTVGQGHDIASAVRSSVMQADPNVVSVIVHVEPAEQPGAGFDGDDHSHS